MMVDQDALDDAVMEKTMRTAHILDIDNTRFIEIVHRHNEFVATLEGICSLRHDPQKIDKLILDLFNFNDLTASEALILGMLFGGMTKARETKVTDAMFG